MTFYSTLRHPLIGTLLLVTDGEQLVRSSYADSKFAPEIEKDWKRDPKQPVLREAISQLKQYLGGSRNTLTVPLRIEGTEFQKKVYNLILEVPAGAVTTYMEIAKKYFKRAPLEGKGIDSAKRH